MKSIRISHSLILTLLLLCSTATSARASELREIERKISKEPAYQTKQVKYALLVFGPEAKTRIWLAVDGESVYVDRNGNGDLTEEGEKVAAANNELLTSRGIVVFELKDLPAEKLVHKNFTLLVSALELFASQDDSARDFLVKNPGAKTFQLTGEIEMPGWNGNGVGGRVVQRTFYTDARGLLQFADKPEAAPIIHFGGSWQVALFGPQKLTLGRDVDLVLGVGTPGIAPGTTTWIDYAGVIPETAFPTAAITFPVRNPGAEPVTELYELKRRC